MEYNKKNILKNHLYVITGGPSVGKTRLIEELKKRSFNTVEEDARKLIKEEIQTMGDAIPWKNKESYARKMLTRSINTYQTIQKSKINEPIFFDRGILDSLCYIEMENLNITCPINEEQVGILYHKEVFILPPWKHIYTTDNERKQDWDTCLFTYKKMVKTYKKYGYKLIHVPPGSITVRVDFILQHLGLKV